VPGLRSSFSTRDNRYAEFNRQARFLRRHYLYRIVDS